MGSVGLYEDTRLSTDLLSGEVVTVHGRFRDSVGELTEEMLHFHCYRNVNGEDRWSS